MTRQELIQQIKQKESFLCVGLDTDAKKMPQCVFDLHDPIFEFNKAIIDATAPYCVAYKPNLAFYEAYGVKGMISFEKTIQYLKEHHPHHMIIADAKRGDIGNTSQMYARTFFEEYDVDALTVAPYMGEDSVTPFLGYEGKWVILLALTSNKGSQDFQLTPLHTPLVGRWGPGNFKGDRLYEKVLKTSKEWGNEDNMMYVVGATQGLLFERVRDIVPHHFLLVPGVGAQGGSLEEVCKYGMTEDCGLLVNSSRGIIYASNDDHYAEIAGNKARELQQQMAEELKKAGII
ncbi:MAG: orotidine-5'-phosphate decarboxylase [Prevotella sp.]|nr:orotidine-5'-phosphate decarboxylase [Prevotella sp.]